MFLLVCLILAGCSSNNRYRGTINTIDLNYTDVDMSVYEGFTDTEHAFRKIGMHESLRVFEEEGSALLYFGYSHCPWCIAVVPIINEAAKEAGLPVYYVDVADKEGREEDDLEILESYTEKYLSKNSEGEITFYVPVVFVVRNGEAVDAHISAVKSYNNAYEREMTDEEKEELLKIYHDMFERLLPR